MFGRGICEKYQSRDKKIPELRGEENLVSRLVFVCRFHEYSVFIVCFMNVGEGIIKERNTLPENKAYGDK